MSVNSTPALNKQKVEEWADNVVKAWITKMASLGVFDSPRNRGLLARSFTHTIIWEARGTSTEEHLHRIKFAFMAYGKFVDYGLGRGTDMKDRFGGGRNNATNPRKRKQWIQKPWKDALKLIYPILVAHYGDVVRMKIKTNFEETTDVSFKTK